jgi:hypothetical protein
MIDIELPDLRGHPPSPRVDLATFERYVIDVFIPQAIASGELTQESSITHFKNNEGRQTEPWPDFSGIKS